MLHLTFTPEVELNDRETEEEVELLMMMKWSPVIGSEGWDYLPTLVMQCAVWRHGILY